MAGSDNSGMIDGFMSVRAVRHKHEHAPGEVRPETASEPHASAENTAVDAAEELRRKAAIGRTALPTRHELVCYSCGYEFVVTGSLNKVFCPKCREQLETGNHEVVGHWTEDVLTVGRIWVRPGAVVKGATLTGTDIIVGGDCSEANLKPSRRIELESGAKVAPALLNDSKLTIRAGSRIQLDEPLRCDVLDIRGELHADAMPSGTVTIYAGGLFRGKLIASSLVVHDGGGLSAELRITPKEQKPKNADPKRKLPDSKNAAASVSAVSKHVVVETKDVAADAESQKESSAKDSKPPKKEQPRRKNKLSSKYLTYTLK